MSERQLITEHLHAIIDGITMESLRGLHASILTFPFTEEERIGINREIEQINESMRLTGNPDDTP